MQTAGIPAASQWAYRRLKQLTMNNFFSLPDLLFCPDLIHPDPPTQQT